MPGPNIPIIHFLRDPAGMVERLLVSWVTELTKDERPSEVYFERGNHEDGGIISIIYVALHTGLGWHIYIGSL